MISLVMCDQSRRDIVCYYTFCTDKLYYFFTTGNSNELSTTD